MKKTLNLTVILQAALIILALILFLTGSVNGKLLNGGSAIRVSIGEMMDTDTVKSLAADAGFGDANFYNVGHTYVELETGTMSEKALQDKAEKLVASLKTKYANAELVYAEHFEANTLTGNVKNFLFAALCFAVLAFLYGWIRWDIRKSLAVTLESVLAGFTTIAVCAIFSFLFPAEPILLGAAAGAMILTYISYMAILGKFYADKKYTFCNCDMLVSVVVLIAALAVMALSGSVKTMVCMPIAVVISAAAFYLTAPQVMTLGEKKTDKE